MRLRKKYGRRGMKRKSGGGWEGGGEVRGAEVRMVALRGSVTRQSTAGIRHMLVETGREPQGNDASRGDRTIGRRSAYCGGGGGSYGIPWEDFLR
jgi:hypothetical protein